MLDFGGGFPGNDDKAVKFEEIAESINKGITDFFPNAEEEGMEFIAEPGRFLAQRTHTLVMNVIGKKIVNAEKEEDKTIVYYLNDGVYGSFNCIFFDHEHPVILPFNERDGKQYKSLLWGPTCDSIDMISENVMLPELAIGEWVYVENFGAYTVAASSSFNGFRTNTYKYILRS